jgi:tRNA (guanine37-N1)-methyltransferase
MKYNVLTLFPEMIKQGLDTSIIGRAMEKGLLELDTVDIRDFTTNKHKKVDDYPYGGGAGMVMQAEPVYNAYQSIIDNRIDEKKPRVIFLTPQGKVFNQTIAKELAAEKELIFLCGHYEGIDERVLEMIVTDNISIGDYVLTGGELAAMVVIDAVSRLVPGVLNNDVSAEIESFHDNLLEYPQYTRPEEFHGIKVPEVLLSGHHGNIEKWRRKQSIQRTIDRRPDLINDANLTEVERKELKQQ